MEHPLENLSFKNLVMVKCRHTMKNRLEAKMFLSFKAPSRQLIIFLELLLMVDAAKRASAESVTVVMPYFGYARQDRKDKPRVALQPK